MLDGQVSLLTYLATAWLNTGNVPPRMGNRHLSIAPYSTFNAADGWLNIAVANQRLWSRFCQVINRTDLEHDDRYATNAQRVANVDALEVEIESSLAEDTVEAWTERFDEAGIPAGPVLKLDQVLSHAQLIARQMVTSFEHPEAGTVRATGIPHRLEDTPGRIRRSPPCLGEHTNEALEALGYSREAIQSLRDKGVIA